MTQNQKKTDQTKMQNKCRSNTLCRTNEDQKLCTTNEYLTDQTNLVNQHVQLNFVNF